MPNPFAKYLKTIAGTKCDYYDFVILGGDRLAGLPISIRVLLESVVRNCDDFEVTQQDVETVLNWAASSKAQKEIAFKPARVLLQDFTGVPAVVDLAGMRDVMSRFGGNPSKINPLVPVDLVVDHSVQVDYARTPDAVEKNMEVEFNRNLERFQFLKWGASAFDNMLVVPPGSGIVHQVNLEYLARVVFQTKQKGSDGPKTEASPKAASPKAASPKTAESPKSGSAEPPKSGSASPSNSSERTLMYPDSVVGTDSHTTMVNGLGVLGWGVGGIEAESVMLNQPTSMVLPEVVGFKLTGKLTGAATATDLVLTVTTMLRKLDVVGKFVEFFGPGVQSLSVADRSTVANMAPEYGSTVGFFPVDSNSLDYLLCTGRDKAAVERAKSYLKAVGLLVDYSDEATFSKIQYTQVVNLDLSKIEPSIAGPKRPHDCVLLSKVAQEFTSCLTASPVDFKNYAIPKDKEAAVSKFSYKGQASELSHGSVVIAAITSCTNTSNPSVMLAAGLLAKKAVDAGLDVKKHIKTSLSPGSGVVLEYLKQSGLLQPLEQLGFYVAGFGCMTCIGNSGELDKEVGDAITSNDLVVSAVLSGNRNFEGRVHPLTRANYLCSPPLVVAYAIAGNMKVDLSKDPIGVSSKTGKPVFLKDIWPSREEIAKVEAQHVTPAVFNHCYKSLTTVNKRWNDLPVPKTQLYQWDAKSTYIHDPPFFKTMGKTAPGVRPVKLARCLLSLGDSITTDHISPAGNIAKDSPAAKYLVARGTAVGDFNSYGSRRGNDEIMARATFANIRLVNKLMSLSSLPPGNRIGPKTVHFPSNEVMEIFDAATRYAKDHVDSVLFAGKDYGSGSSRDWAAKGPYLLGIKAVVAESFERIHRSNLVGMGILPLQFLDGMNAEKLGIKGNELFSLDLENTLAVGQTVTVSVIEDTPEKKVKSSFKTKVRIDTEVEVEYYKHGGSLHYVLRKLLNAK